MNRGGNVNANGFLFDTHMVSLTPHKDKNAKYTFYLKQLISFEDFLSVEI